MNKDQVKGVTKEATGEVKEQVGKVLHDDELRAKGHAEEFAGKAQKEAGDAHEAAKDVAKDVAKDLERKP